MLFTAFLWVFLLQTQKAAFDVLTGEWNNQDSSTSGVTAVAVSMSSEGGLRARVWGKCEPADCEWGLADVHFTNGMATATFDTGFATTQMEFVPLMDGRLLVFYKTEYKDGSNRTNYEHVEFLARRRTNLEANSPEAEALLARVAERYRNLKFAEFKSERFDEYLGKKNQIRRPSVSRTLVAQPDKYRVETTGPGEETIVISNGKYEWTFFPESNQYEVLPAGQAGFSHTPVAPYVLLDQFQEQAQIVGKEHVIDADCTVVKLGHDPDHGRTLWVDPKTDFVRRDETIDVSRAEGGMFSRKSVITFSVAQAAKELGSNEFSFDPKEVHAKLRSELQKQTPVTSIGALAPDFVLLDLKGTRVRLSELRGKVVLLDFWAAWCEPCRAAMPTLELIRREFKDKGVIVLGVDDEEPEDQSSFLEEFGYTIPSLVDSSRRVNNLYNVGGIPTTIVIDRDGKIRAYEVGDATYESLWDTINSL